MCNLRRISANCKLYGVEIKENLFLGINRMIKELWMSDGYQFVNNDNIIKSNSSQKRPLLAPLMYSLYGHPRYFNLKCKYQEYGRVSRLIFRF